MAAVSTTTKLAAVPTIASSASHSSIAATAALAARAGLAPPSAQALAITPTATLASAITLSWPPTPRLPSEAAGWHAVRYALPPEPGGMGGVCRS